MLGEQELNEQQIDGDEVSNEQQVCGKTTKLSIESMINDTRKQILLNLS